MREKEENKKMESLEIYAEISKLNKWKTIRNYWNLTVAFLQCGWPNMRVQSIFKIEFLGTSDMLVTQIRVVSISKLRLIGPVRQCR